MSAMNVFFWAFSLVAGGSALAVVISQNVVRMAFWLIISLGAVAGLFFLCDADLLGSAQLLIYAGGTLVLLVFGVMLTASGPFMSLKTNPGEAVLGGLVGATLLGFILYTAVAVDWKTVSPKGDDRPPVFDYRVSGNSTRPLGFSLLGMRPDRDLGEGAKTLSVSYLMPFEIVSVHLLVVLVGAAYLARSKRRKEPAGVVAGGGSSMEGSAS